MPTWYVRPNTSHNAVRDGTTYATAWGGWSEIPWGTTLFSSTVQHTVYVCGSHSYSSSIAMANTGSTAVNPTIVRGDYAPDPGIITFTNASVANRLYSIGKKFSQHYNLTLINGQIYVGYNANAGNDVIVSGFNVTVTDTTADVIVIDGGQVNSSYSNITLTGITSTGGKRFLVWFCDQVSGAGYSNLAGLTVSNNNASDLQNSAIELRTSTRVDQVNTYARNIAITGNRFTRTGQGASGGALLRLDVSNGLATGPSYNCIVTDNYCQQGGFLSTTDTIGGIGYAGFGSSEEAYTKNIIARNFLADFYGSAGGIDICRSKYVDVFDNYIEDMYTSTQDNPIDAAGIFIDQGSNKVRVHRNFIRNTPGSALVWNSGYAIAGYLAYDFEVYSNICVGNRYGFTLSNQTTLLCDGTSGVNTITFANGAYGQTVNYSTVYPGMQVTGTGIGAGAIVQSVTGTSALYTVTLVNSSGAAVNNTGTITGGTITFKMPTSVKCTVKNNVFLDPWESGVYLRNTQVQLFFDNNVFANTLSGGTVEGIKLFGSVSGATFTGNQFVNEVVDGAYLINNRYISEASGSAVRRNYRAFLATQREPTYQETFSKTPFSNPPPIGADNL